MGIVAPEKKLYESAVAKLFPRGEWWDAQFADAESDASLFASAKAEGIFRFRLRMAALLDEGRIETTEETIGDWERVLLGETNPGLPLEERRELLTSRENARLNRGEIEAVAAQFGLTIRAVDFPFRPGFFGFTRFAVERPAGFASFSAVRIACADADFSRHRPEIKAAMEKCRFAFMRMGTNRMAHFPVGKMHGSGFFARFADVLTEFYIYHNKPYADFENAIGEKLLANHIPIFEYGEEE